MSEITLNNKKPKFDDFIKINCTYVLFGPKEKLQNTYYCLSCDPQKQNSFCFECFQACHTNCLKIFHKDETSQKLFICNCGMNKHFIKQKIEKTEITTLHLKCSIKQLPFSKENFYKCLSCNKIACYICIYSCHKSCQNDSRATQDESFNCECESDKHLYNNFLFDKNGYEIYKISGLINFHQFIYFQCEGGVFNNLFDIIDFSQKRSYFVDEFVKMLCSTLTRESFEKSFCLYHPRLLKAFSLENILTRLSNGSKLESNVMHYYSILYNFHLKNDFQGFNKLSAYAYLNSSIRDRIEHKNILKYNVADDIQEKYSIYKFKGSKTLTSIFNIINTMIDEMIIINKNERIPIVKLKIIYFCMIYHMLDINELILLVSKLHQFFDNRSGMIYLKYSTGDDKVKAQTIQYYNYLVKIFYVIAIIYNDIVYIEIEYGNKNHSFIHSENEIGTMLLTMILKLNPSVVASNFNIPCFKSSILLLYNEILALFTFTDNKFGKDLLKLKLTNTVRVDRKPCISGIVKEFDDDINSLKLEVFLVKKNNIFGTFENIINKFIQKLYLTRGGYIANTKYPNKLKKFIAKFFPNIEDINFENINKDLTFELRKTNVCETLLRILTVYYKTEKLEENSEFSNSFESTIVITLFLALDREGMISLINGKLLSLISLLCDNRISFLLDCYYLIFKGLNFYKIKLCNNKNFHVALSFIQKYLKEISNYNNDNKTNLIKCFKILKTQSYNIDFEDLKHFKTQALKNLKISNLFQLNSFFTLFSGLQINFSEIKIQMLEELSKFKKSQSEFGILSKKTSNLDITTGDRYKNILTINKISDSSDFFKTDNKIEVKFYTSFFDFIIKDLNYTFKEEYIESELITVRESIDLNIFKTFLESNFLSINQRIITLKFIISFHVLPIINSQQIQNEIQNGLSFDKYFSTDQYYDFIYSNNNNSDDNITTKFNALKTLSLIIEIFQQEFEHLVVLSYSNLNKVYKIYEFIKLLIDFIKYISDFFFSVKTEFGDSFSNHMTLKFYKLAEVFLSRYSIIRMLLNQTAAVNPETENIKISLINSLEKLNCENDFYNDLISINDYFDTNAIYKIIISAIKTIEPYINETTNLEKHFIFYDTYFSKEYFSKNKITKGDLQMFYKDENKNILNAGNCENIFYEEYMNQFLNIDNTNLLVVLNTLNGEDELFYTKTFADYFMSHILSYYHISESFNMTMLALITKLFDFKKTKLQKCFNTSELAYDVIGNLYNTLNKLITIIAECSIFI
jgi:hypothetical protein